LFDYKCLLHANSLSVQKYGMQANITDEVRKDYLKEQYFASREGAISSPATVRVSCCEKRFGFSAAILKGAALRRQPDAVWTRTADSVEKQRVAAAEFSALNSVRAPF
jgi:hypothetical protein